MVARLSLTEIMVTASPDIALPYVYVVLWPCWCRRDGSQTLWPVIPQDPSGWGATVATLSSSFSGTEATCNGSLHTLGHQFCSFTCELFCKWCLVLLVYWPPAYLFGLLFPVNSIQVALPPLKNCCQEYGEFGALSHVFGRTDWSIKPSNHFCCFLVFPKCPFTYLSSN